MTPEVGAWSADQDCAYAGVCGGIQAGAGHPTKKHIACWTWAGSRSYGIDAMALC